MYIINCNWRAVCSFCRECYLRRFCPVYLNFPFVETSLVEGLNDVGVVATPAFVISVGLFGLLITWVLRVAITDVWSDDSSWLDSI
jgi:hypothetical protein